MASEKRCLYEILGLNRDCSAEEIRSSYKKLALQRHPDKLIKTGIPEDQATASFQELVNAYEVLSDPRERSWYDSHRSQILFSDAKSSFGSGSSAIPDLFSFFSNSVFSGYGDTGKGFFKVYGDIFGKIYAQELSFAKKLGLGLDSVRDAPLMGNLDCQYEQVSAFYNYWLGFCTIMDFCWVDEYDASAGPNRKSRRLMEEENKKVRKKARKEYNETVRGLAEFVKKRDKRVIEMQMKRSMEQEKKRTEEMVRKKEIERAKLEKARLYEEPEWAKLEEQEIENGYDEEEDDKKNENKEFYCVVCSKKFKSDKQWKNHEQSKKHREKVAEFRASLSTEEEEEEEVAEEKIFGPDVDETHVGSHPSMPVDDGLDELQEQFEDSFSIREQQTEVKPSSSFEEEIDVSDDVNDQQEGGESFASNKDDEMNILKAMFFGHKSKKNAGLMHQPKSSSEKAYESIDSEEMNFMEYNNQKGSRRNRAAKREGGKKSNGDTVRAAVSKISEEVTSKSNEGDSMQASSNIQESTSHSFEETVTNVRADKLLDRNRKALNQPADNKGTGKKDTNTKLKNSSKGKKQKGTSKSSGHSCDTCGENFESRNKLHMHLGDTGHASLKSR